MISDARGGHVSPGVYTEERDVTYSTKSLGITSLGLVGETVKGPAFQSVEIEDWTEFVDYFGGTSPEKFKGTGYPKYELPYVAKSYLNESKRLNVVRVLGLSGYEAGSAFTVTAKNLDTAKSYPVVVLRSKADYDGEVSGDTCGKVTQEKYRPWVTSVELSDYSGSTFDSMCAIEPSGYTVSKTGMVTALDDGSNVLYDENCQTVDRFSLKVTYEETPGSSMTVSYNCSLNPSDRDYIYNIFSVDPLVGSAPLFIEAVYDYAFNDMIQNAASAGTLNVDDSGNTICGSYKTQGTRIELGMVTGTTMTCPSSDTKFDFTDYKEAYRCAQSPWFVSEVKTASDKSINLKKLFKFFTISDGNAANYQVKISIERIRPDEGLFDVVIRDFYDTDAAQVVLERYINLSMVEGASNFIGLKIGTFDGTYEAKSKYVTVLISDEEGVDSCVPCGILGYPVPEAGASDKIELAYNTKYDDEIKPKRQYFGLNSDILDEDILNYKGATAYNNVKFDADICRLTNGFHMDAILNESVRKASGSTLANAEIFIDNESGYTFTTVDPIQVEGLQMSIPRINTENYMDSTIYQDIKLRKFTAYLYGGFDGWDIYRDSRTNTDKYKATKYPIVDGCPFEKIGAFELDLDPTLNLGLPANAINSDYYAYLAGFRQFANPSDVEINVYATPGIDYAHNLLLVEDSLDVIEDPEDGRGGDALYVINSPFDEEEFNSPDVVVDNLNESELDTSYACTYWPWIKFYDADARVYLHLPATKDVVRNFAMIDNTSYPWFAPAGMQRGDVNCVKASYKTTLTDEDTLYLNRINPIKTFGKDGVKVWGNKTLYSKDTPLNRINVRRLMLRVKKLVTDASKYMIFDQYDVTLDKQFKSLVEPILADVKSNRGIIDYRVMTESTPETRDQHILPARILIKPVNALEYISISFVVYPESVAFENEG